METRPLWTGSRGWESLRNISLIFHPRFIPGRELRVGVVELRPGQLTPLGVLEYKVDREKIRTYEDKLEGAGEKLRQVAGTVTWFLDPEEEGDLVTRLQQVATSVHRVMGARDFSQIDCR